MYVFGLGRTALRIDRLARYETNIVGEKSPGNLLIPDYFAITKVRLRFHPEDRNGELKK